MKACYRTTKRLAFGALPGFVFLLSACSPPLRDSSSSEPAEPRSRIELDTPAKKYSYILGQDMGRYVADLQKNLQFKVDRQVFFRSLCDVLDGVQPLMTEEEMLAVKRERLRELRKKWEAQRKAREAKRRALAEKNRKLGAAFLAENRKKPGVVVTPSGLQYLILRQGTGPRPSLQDRVTISFETRLIDGTIVDSSEKRGKPLVFKLRNGIRGWREGIQLMPKGSRWRFFIPPDLAYGDWGRGSLIPPGATLVCDIELLDIQKLSKSGGPRPQKKARNKP